MASSLGSVIGLDQLTDKANDVRMFFRAEDSVDADFTLCQDGKIRVQNRGKRCLHYFLKVQIDEIPLRTVILMRMAKRSW